jgi:hypothetical protein
VGTSVYSWSVRSTGKQPVACDWNLKYVCVGGGGNLGDGALTCGN